MGTDRDAAETIEATVERVVFHNPSNGWTVLRVHSESMLLDETVVGSFQRVSPGERFRFTGRWSVDRKHGRQFTAETCVPVAPATVKGIEKFLGSGLIPGVGPVMAGRIVVRFGAEALEIIERDPKRLTEIPGIGPKRAAAIRSALVANRAVKEVMVFLESVGISPAFAHRIYKRYGHDAIRIVSEDPFRLASEVHGIGFLSADRIASRLGMPPDAPRRAEAGLIYALEEQAGDGHVFARQETLVACARELLSIDEAALGLALERLVLSGKVRREGSGAEAAVYLPRLHRAEQIVAESLGALLRGAASPLPIGEDEAIALGEARSGIALAPEQREAFRAAARSRVTVLTGGPGTGKTTLLRGLDACLRQLALRVELAAPTGRAARRMSEATGQEARTLHRLLEFQPGTMRFERNAQNRLEADMVIVDEMSMVDIELFAALISALRPSARLMLVGDPDQLPSVGPGAVLSDLIALARLPGSGIASVHLRQIFRQAMSSLIVTGAHDVLAGREPDTGEKGSEADLFLVEREEPEACLEVIKELVTRRIPGRFGFDPVGEIQVLAPMHRGLLGTANLNRELQALLNPPADSGTEAGRLRLGDKVMQVRNNYDLEVFNGDIGRVTGAGESGWIEVAFPERSARYPDTELDQLSLAYACSVHKSQGSEYPAVVIPLHTQHYVMLRRNLLYTAITRGRKLVVLVGMRKALRMAVRNAAEIDRGSGLVDRVRRLLD